VDATSGAGGLRFEPPGRRYYFAPRRDRFRRRPVAAVLSPAALERVARIHASGRWVRRHSISTSQSSRVARPDVQHSALATLCCSCTSWTGCWRAVGSIFAAGRSERSASIVRVGRVDGLTSPFVAKLTSAAMWWGPSISIRRWMPHRGQGVAGQRRGRHRALSEAGAQSAADRHVPPWSQRRRSLTACIDHVVGRLKAPRQGAGARGCKATAAVGRQPLHPPGALRRSTHQAHSGAQPPVRHVGRAGSPSR